LTCFRFDISPHIQLLKCDTHKNGSVNGHQAVCLAINHQSPLCISYPHLSLPFLNTK